MKIALLDGDLEDSEFAAKKLREAFPGYIVEVFASIQRFVEAEIAVSGWDLIITEEHLAAMARSADAKELWNELSQRFPAMFNEDTEVKPLHKLLRHLRQTGIMTPLIIYTHSNEDWVAESGMLAKAHTFFVPKETDRSANLISCVREIFKQS